ncbi:hypothetical protein HOH87_06005 [bacterium]|jgi:hypothetical protein|nr:hypothetical protein [bacterium]
MMFKVIGMDLEKVRFPKKSCLKQDGAIRSADFSKKSVRFDMKDSNRELLVRKGMQFFGAFSVASRVGFLPKANDAFLNDGWHFLATEGASQEDIQKVLSMYVKDGGTNVKTIVRLRESLSIPQQKGVLTDYLRDVHKETTKADVVILNELSEGLPIKERSEAAKIIETTLSSYLESIVSKREDLDDLLKVNNVVANLYKVLSSERQEGVRSKYQFERLVYDSSQSPSAFASVRNYLGC